MDGEEVQCGICFVRGSFGDVQNHLLQAHSEEGANENIQSSSNQVITEITPENVFQTSNCQEQPTNTYWSSEHVVLLIRLIEKYYSEFSRGIKKNVYIKIANEMKNITGKKFTYEQIESKWKGLKKTYKNVKDHNKKSGNSIKRWQYFEIMDTFMAKKPEVNPISVCSSTSATIILNENIGSSTNSNISFNSTRNSCSSSNEENTISSVMPQSILGKKRKHAESAIQRRHEEKMSRVDKFLKLFQMTVEHQTGKKIDDSEK